MEKPVIYSTELESFKNILKNYPGARILDKYQEILEDLFLIRNPKFKFDKNYKTDFEVFAQDHKKGKHLKDCGTWVYFPWSHSLVHYLDDLLHQEVRTARNKNLITKEEQSTLYNFSVGIAGLSVGSHGALTIALIGGAREIKIADPDIISASNLNRMRFDFTQIGLKKVEAVAQYIYQLNPYSTVSIFDDGITSQNLDNFFDGLDLVVEELDDIEVKITIREEAKKRKIPVIMATDNGDNVIMDIERFDQNPHLPIFHGNLEGFDVSSIKESPQKMYEAMARIIDIKLVPSRVFHSINEVGKTLYSWPQLATAATLSGAAIAYVIQKIALSEEINSGKVEISFDEVLDAKYQERKITRLKDAEAFLKQLNNK